MPSQVRAEGKTRTLALEKAKKMAVEKCGDKDVKQHGDPSFSEPYGDGTVVCDYWFECV